MTFCICPTLSVPFLLDELVGKTEAEIVTKVTNEVGSSNRFLNGIIGIVLKVNDPTIDVSSYQIDIDIIVNHCVEFYILSRHRRVREFPLYFFVLNMFLLVNLVQYVSIILDYLVLNNVFVISGGDYVLVFSNSTYYSFQSAGLIASANDNLVVSLGGMLYTTYYSCIESMIFTLENTTLDDIIVRYSNGSILLPANGGTITLEENYNLTVSSSCNVLAQAYIIDLTRLLYASDIISIAG